jgi:hypothetical protein
MDWGDMGREHFFYTNWDTHKIKVGDLVLKKRTNKPFIVLEVKKYNRESYGARRRLQERKRYLLFSHDGKQNWVIDTSLRVEYYLPDPK